MANPMITQSAKIGGGAQVFSNIELNTLPIGYNLDPADLPEYGNVLPAGTPVFADDATMTAKPSYAFKLYENATTTEVKIEKGIEGTRAKVGMHLVAAPTAITGTGTGYTISAVDSSNADYDVLTMSAAVTASKGDIMLEADKVGTGAKAKVVPNGITICDIEKLPGAYTYHTAVAYNLINGVVYERRLPPYCAAVKAALKASDCYFRFSTQK